MAKEFKYKGKSLEELQAMSNSELADILPASKRRKIKRGFTSEEKKFAEKIKFKNNVKTHLRDMIILPYMVNKTIKVHNGKEYKQVIVQPEMIGHCLGEFSLTRSKSKHSAPGVGATRSSSALSVR